jgi:phenylacetate-CoA ligase
MNPFFAKLARRMIRAQLSRSSPQKLLQLGEKKLLNTFRRAAQRSPAYRQLLQDAGVQAGSVLSPADFARLCPLLEKSNTFHRFPLDQLLVSDVKPAQLASVLTSSGHGKSGFALGLSTRAQYQSTPFLIDLGLDIAFDVDRRRTLLINCLPMGVTFQSAAVCVANVSVREDMACAIVEQAGSLFEQIVLCGDPLFLKRLCDYAGERGIDWSRHRVNVIIGEETFTESFRDYLAGCLQIQNGRADGGWIGSSMGVGELGLNLFNETRETVALRRACAAGLRPQLLAGLPDDAALPTLMCFNPLRTYVEILNPDTNGDGDLVVSMLDPAAPVPLLRYKTGDHARLISSELIASVLSTSNTGLAAPVLPMIALHGRSKDYLPNGWHVDHFKHVLYAQHETAHEFSGAFRLSQTPQGLQWEVQLRAGSKADPSAAARVLRDGLMSLGKANYPTISCLNYETFPYGKSLDYERKFTYWAG